MLITEDILVRIRNFFVLVDFVVLDMQVDEKACLILGRPFLSTANAQIDIRAQKIQFHMNGKEERFAFKPKAEQCSMIKEEEQWHK